jgi:hypothetical protein
MPLTRIHMTFREAAPDKALSAHEICPRANAECIKIMVYHVHANSLGAMLSSIEKSLRERRNKGHFDNEADKGFERREQ